MKWWSKKSLKDAAEPSKHMEDWKHQIITNKQNKKHQGNGEIWLEMRRPQYKLLVFFFLN